MVLMVAFGAAGLSALGFWQLARGNAKADLLQQMQLRNQQSSVSVQQLVALPSSQWHGRRVRLQGVALLGLWVVLDNRIHQGRAGYEWLLPVATDQGIVLVNYGWTEPGESREVLSPPLQISNNENMDMQVQMVVEEEPFRLSEQALEAGWPLRVQWLDYPALQKRYGRHVLPAYARLLQGAVLPQSNRPAVAMPPERHYGYAVQWFLLALAWCLCCLFYYRHLTKAGNNE